MMLLWGHSTLPQIWLFWNIVTLCSPYQCVELALYQRVCPLHHLPPTSGLHSATAEILCWTVLGQDPTLVGLQYIYIHNHFLVISDLELDLMPVNQFSIHLVSAVLVVYSLLSKTFYGNKPDALEKLKYVTVPLLPSQPNFNLHSVEHCVRYELSSSILYYALHHLLHDPLDSGSSGLPSPFPSASFIHSDKNSVFQTSGTLLLFQNCFKYQLQRVP